jgi:hypothetical protein
MTSSSSDRLTLRYRLDIISARVDNTGMKKWSDPEVTDLVAAFYAGLTEADADLFDAAVERLAEIGPTLGRPTVAEIDLSRESAALREALPHLKELRVGSSIRVLFTFGPDRVPVLLVAGDKPATGRAGTGRRSRKRPGSTRLSPRHRAREVATGPSKRPRHLCRQEQENTDGEEVQLRPPRGDPGAARRIDTIKRRDDRRRAPGALRPTRRHPGGARRTPRRSQGQVSQIERRDDLYLSTLRDYVEALGGTLEVAAVFDDERTPIAIG